MRTKRFTLASACAAFVLVGGLVAISTPAFADDAPPPAPDSSAAPVAATLADAAPASTSDTSSTPAPAASADPAPSTDATAPVVVSAPALIDAAITTVPAVVITTPPADPYVAVLWSTDTYGVKYSQHIVSITHEATETLPTIPATCGMGYQGDVYLESADLEALLDNGAGVLTGPDGAQDGTFLAPGGDGVAYSYVVNATCPPPPPAGITCQATGTSYTEDVDWASTAAGKQLAGPTTLAIDHYYGVTGNLQGLTNLSITETTTGTGGESALEVIEVNPHGALFTGGPASTYETLTPVGPNADGTTNEISGLFYSSSIEKLGNNNAPGALGDPQPLSWFVTEQPNNTLISIGVHFQSNSTANTSVVSAIDAGCLTQSYPWPSVSLPDGSQTGPTCAVPADGSAPNGGWYTLPVLPSTAKYALEADGVTRPVAGMYVLQPGQTVSFTAHTLASAMVQPTSRVYTFTGAALIPEQSTDATAACYQAPAVPTKPASFTTPKVLGYTGDDTPYGLWGGLALLTILAASAAIIITRRKDRAAE